MDEDGKCITQKDIKEQEEEKDKPPQEPHSDNPSIQVPPPPYLPTETPAPPVFPTLPSLPFEPTETPGTVIGPGPTPTSSLVYESSTGKFYIIEHPWFDWSKLSTSDQVGAIIDIAGLVGDVAALFPPTGEVIYFISIIGEAGGIAYDIYDIFWNKDTSDLSLKLIKTGVDVGAGWPNPYEPIFSFAGLAITTREGWYMKESVIHFP
jgi:hypothetical protein